MRPAREGRCQISFRRYRGAQRGRNVTALGSGTRLSAFHDGTVACVIGARRVTRSSFFGPAQRRGDGRDHGSPRSTGEESSPSGTEQPPVRYAYRLADAAAGRRTVNFWWMVHQYGADMTLPQIRYHTAVLGGRAGRAVAS